jgi:methyl-accepting chemotaxis protein/aerotaxis receptor
MEEIVAAVRRVEALMNQITAASAEQAGGIEQVTRTIGHIDGVTQQNAALVEQRPATTGRLSTGGSRPALRARVHD